jgi:hypothetical protein
MARKSKSEAEELLTLSFEVQRVGFLYLSSMNEADSQKLIDIAAAADVLRSIAQDIRAYETSGGAL